MFEGAECFANLLLNATIRLQTGRQEQQNKFERVVSLNVERENVLNELFKRRRQKKYSRKKIDCVISEIKSSSHTDGSK